MQKIQDKPAIVNDIVPAWKLLINDPIDSVKVRAIENSINIAVRLSKKEVATHIVK